ncbi:competence protein [Flavobacteriales bacterium 33_180_T64]|nr:competence protein [Flavobacteriales bacterium 33_180_T64]
MKPLNFVIIKLSVCLIIGILISHSYHPTLIVSLYSVLFVFAVLIVFYFASKNNFKKSIWFGLTAYLFTSCLGIVTYNLHEQKNFPKHYSHLIDTETVKMHALHFSIKERLKSTYYHDKYVINLIKIDEQDVIGKVLLNIKKDSLQTLYKIDDRLFTYSDIRELNSPLNPNQFDYKTYLEKQYIYHQMVINQNSMIKLNAQKQTIFGFAERIRNTINEKLSLYHFEPEELVIINALILGQRQDMDRQIYEDYANAGAIHILAVSGLHVGIILLLLNFILKPIEYVKQGKTIKVIIIILLLWSFAIIAGLSASVTRAVTMFSVVSIAMHLKRQGNIYNTLSISAFILLLCKPMFLFDVGFQMSYLAVIAIVSIQPKLYKLWSPKWKIVNYFWQIFTVTIAAQLGVIPISLYYFHQFPGLFFVSNLAIIPFLGLILGFGIFIILLALLNILPEGIAHLYGNSISLMNAIVTWVSKQEQFLFQNISFDLPHVVACYIVIIALFLLYKKATFKRIAFLLVSILFIQGIGIYYNYRNANNTFIIFHKSRYSLIGQKTNFELKVFDNLDSIATMKDKVITNFSVGNFVDTIKRERLKSVYSFHNKTILIIDSLGIYNVKKFQPDYIVLRNSPRLNLDRLIDSIHPKFIIADGSNYKSYVKRWEETCKKRKLPFHQTSKKGAFIIKEANYP